jgi:hypothetical protein
VKTLEERYLEAVRRLRRRTGYLEAMARWEEDLGGRLWRAQAISRLTGEAFYDMKALEEEVRLFNLVAANLKGQRDA